MYYMYVSKRKMKINLIFKDDTIFETLYSKVTLVRPNFYVRNTNTSDSPNNVAST